MIIFISIILLLICVVAFFVVIFNFVGSFMTGVPFMSSDQKGVDIVLPTMELAPGSTICDLGCGKAQILIHAYKKYGCQGIGYELSIWPYILARINVWLARADVKIYFANFFQADLGQVDVIYCYLFPKIMERLEGKLKRELKSGVRMVSYVFKLPSINPEKIITTNTDKGDFGKFYVYRF